MEWINHSPVSTHKKTFQDFSKGFDGIPNNIDSAMVWAVNKKIYFFKGSQYWKVTLHT